MLRMILITRSITAIHTMISCSPQRTGAHVKTGLYPFLYSRKASNLVVGEPGAAMPVIKYIRHRRTENQELVVSSWIDADELPFTVTLHYSVNGGQPLHSDMARC
ncbi:MAG: hypothetical protein R2727_09685 [Bacteroidales bacterium]